MLFLSQGEQYHLLKVSFFGTTSYEIERNANIVGAIEPTTSSREFAQFPTSKNACRECQSL